MGLSPPGSGKGHVVDLCRDIPPVYFYIGCFKIKAGGSKPFSLFPRRVQVDDGNPGIQDLQPGVQLKRRLVGILFFPLSKSWVNRIKLEMLSPL